MLYIFLTCLVNHSVWYYYRGTCICEYMTLVIFLLQLYHCCHDNGQAVSVLQTAISLHPAAVDEETINILAELLVAAKSYQEAFQVCVCVCVCVCVHV